MEPVVERRAANVSREFKFAVVELMKECGVAYAQVSKDLVVH
jgi:transposase-like protein